MDSGAGVFIESEGEYSGELSGEYYSDEDDIGTVIEQNPHLSFGPTLSTKAISDMKSLDAQQNESVPKVQPPAKRGRGRPRKNSGTAVTFDMPREETRDTQSLPFLEPLQKSRKMSNKEREKVEQKILDFAFSPNETNTTSKSQKAQTYDYADGNDEDPELVEKTKLLKQIEMYHNFYPDIKESCPRKSKWSLRVSLKDMLDELQRCKQKLSIDRAFQAMLTADKFLNFAVEQGVCYMGYPAHGLAAQAAASQDMVMDELRELSIKYVDWFDMGPEARYCIKLLQRVNFVIQQNYSILGAMKEKEERENPNQHITDAFDKYRDL